jgi:hypothetical protein
MVDLSWVGSGISWLESNLLAIAIGGVVVELLAVIFRHAFRRPLDRTIGLAIRRASLYLSIKNADLEIEREIRLHPSGSPQLPQEVRRIASGTIRSTWSDVQELGGTVIQGRSSSGNLRLKAEFYEVGENGADEEDTDDSAEWAAKLTVEGSVHYRQIDGFLVEANEVVTRTILGFSTAGLTPSESGLASITLKLKDPPTELAFAGRMPISHLNAEIGGVPVEMTPQQITVRGEITRETPGKIRDLVAWYS